MSDFKLDTFYQCKEWRDLLSVLKHGRANNDGDIICEYCGEPVTAAYDIIGHHVIELNDINVSDASVSLNPDNIQLVHHKCHNRIHNKLRHGEDMRQAYLVYGSPCSGKTTWVKSVMNAGDLIVDMDNIWQCVSGLDRYNKPARLNACAFGVRDTLLDMVRYRCGKWLNAYIIGGYPLVSERERLCKSLGAREVFIDTNKLTCIDRLMNSNDGRNKEEWFKYIDDWWRKYSPRSYGL